MTRLLLFLGLFLPPLAGQAEAPNFKQLFSEATPLTADQLKSKGTLWVSNKSNAPAALSIVFIKGQKILAGPFNLPEEILARVKTGDMSFFDDSEPLFGTLKEETLDGQKELTSYMDVADVYRFVYRLKGNTLIYRVEMFYSWKKGPQSAARVTDYGVFDLQKDLVTR